MKPQYLFGICSQCQILRKLVSPALGVGLAITMVVLIARPVRADEYDDFNDFCIENFGAEKEVEIYQMFGQSLETSGDWIYISERSSVISWETSLPAKTVVEYGTTPGYGQNTDTEERYLFLHVHYLRDLMPNTLYHYRIVSTDERGNRVESEDRMFTTQTPADVVRVPDDLPGSTPYTLDQADTYYLLTEDITAPATVFNIAESNITLDLGGHIIIYDNVADSPDPAPPGSESTWGWFALPGPCGIRTADGKTVQIVNGVIKQGAGSGGAMNAGYFPVVSRRPRNAEYAGLTIEYTGTHITGILLDSTYEGNHIHHNVIVDRGTEIEDRHVGVDGINFNVTPGITTTSSIHHNLIKRVRHRGIRPSSNTEVYSNEIYIDSWATNSYGVMYYSSNSERPVHDISIHDNRIFGTGYHPIGVGSGYYAHDIAVFSNYIQMQGQAPSAYRWPGGPGDPTGQEHPVNGIRFHQGPQQNIEYHDNTIVVKARGVLDEGAMMRGLWITPEDTETNVVFHDNVIKQVAQNEYAAGHAVAALGSDQDDPGEMITYRDNTISSNTCNVRFGDNYGHGGKHHFTSTTFVRIGDEDRYATIKLGWNGYNDNYNSYGHTFLDSEFEDGASYDQVSVEGLGYFDFTIKWTLVLRTLPGANILIQDVNDDTVFEGTMGSSGEEEIPLSQSLRTDSGETFYTPHTVTVDIDGEHIVETVVMDRRRVLEIYGSNDLVLNGTPADRAIRLTWTANTTVPVTSTWRIDYQSQTGTLYTPITGILSPTRAYTLTGLSNYVWYTVTLNGMLGSTSFLADTVRVKPTDIFVYLPLVLRGY